MDTDGEPVSNEQVSAGNWTIAEGEGAIEHLDCRFEAIERIRGLMSRAESYGLEIDWEHLCRRSREWARVLGRERWCDSIFPVLEGLPRVRTEHVHYDGSQPGHGGVWTKYHLAEADAPKATAAAERLARDLEREWVESGLEADAEWEEKVAEYRRSLPPPPPPPPSPEKQLKAHAEYRKHQQSEGEREEA